MPHFDRFAYTDKRCYGMTAADLGDQKPDRSQVTLQRDEIDALADYVATKIKGLGKVTQQQCYDYYGPGTDDVRQVRSQEPMSAIRSRRPVWPEIGGRPKGRPPIFVVAAVRAQRPNTNTMEVFCISLSSGALARIPGLTTLPPIRTAIYCLPLTE